MPAKLSLVVNSNSSIDQAVARMKAKGIFLSEAAIRAAREASVGD